MKIDYPNPQYYALSQETLISILDTHIKKGLSKQEVQQRQQQFGPNVYEQTRPASLAALFLRQFKNAVVYLLLFGAIVSFYFNDIPEAVSILIVLLINALIGFLMEWQARSSMNELRKMEVIKAKVIRDGYLIEIAAREIVPGDIISLEAGDIVPADGRLIDAQQLLCDESSLTGESQPVFKKNDVLAENTVLAERHNMVFKGTFIQRGNGKAIVTGIAKNTELGHVTGLVERASEETETPLNRKLNRLTKKLIVGTLLITGLFIILEVVRGRSPLTILETAVALSVASIPEGLPIVATIALSKGMLVMARRNAIVKQLAAVETLGSTGVILTDKTGTLTENRIEVNALTFPEEKLTLTKDFGMPLPQKSTGNFQKLVLTGILCNNANTAADTASDPIETSLLELAEWAGHNIKEIRRGYPRITEIPFSSETMMMITLHQGPKGYFTAAKGATEQLLKACDRLQTGHSARCLSQDDREHILRQTDDMAKQGLRVLAFAWKEDIQANHDGFSEGLIFAGLAGFLDPPRQDIRGAIDNCRRAGIRVVMITGDHPHTAANIAHKVGLADDIETEVISGKTLPTTADMTPEWKRRILNTIVFARTTPQQKLDIATVYQDAGYIVAMTGDGINDAPALKKADIGIAMGLRGTQVARETADMVLKDDSFVSITEAIAQGRTIFQNIQKFVIYLVSCNLSEVLTVTLLGIIVPGAELLPLQILFLNVVTDVFPALALGLGSADKSIMSQPPRDPGKDILHRDKWFKIFFYTAIMTSTVVSTVIYGRSLGYEPAMLNNLAFFSLTFAQLTHVFNMSGPRSHFIFNEITSNKFVWGAIVLCLLITGAAYIIPLLRSALSLSVVPSLFWAIAFGCGLIPLILIQAAKYLVIQTKKK